MAAIRRARPDSGLAVSLPFGQSSKEKPADRSRRAFFLVLRGFPGWPPPTIQKTQALRSLVSQTLDRRCKPVATGGLISQREACWRLLCVALSVLVLNWTPESFDPGQGDDFAYTISSQAQHHFLG